MSILILQHSDTGGPGRLGATLRDHGFRLEIRRPDLHPGDTTRGLPADLDDVQGLVILGGPMNLTEIDSLKWMQDEARMIRAAHAAKLPIVGICLGAQLVAHSLGGTVGPKEVPEVGFRNVSINPTGQVEPILSGIRWESHQLFSCGQEIKEPAPGTTLLASSKTSRVAAFRVDVRTFGFLYHFECDRPMAETLLKESGCAMLGAGMTESDSLADLDRYYDTFARLADRLCVNIASMCFPLTRR